MSKALIVGFVDAREGLSGVPVSLVTVVKMADGFYARYPHPKFERNFLKLLDVEKEEDLSFFKEHFWKEDKGRLLDVERGEFAFAFTKEQIFIGTIKELAEEIKRQLQNKELPEFSYKRLQDQLNEIMTEPDLAPYL